jgi:hypothetical protein
MTAARSVRSRRPRAAKPIASAPRAQTLVVIDDPELEQALHEAVAELDRARTEGTLVPFDEAMADIRAELGLPAR